MTIQVICGSGSLFSWRFAQKWITFIVAFIDKDSVNMIIEALRQHIIINGIKRRVGNHEKAFLELGFNDNNHTNWAAGSWNTQPGYTDYSGPDVSTDYSRGNGQEL